MKKLFCAALLCVGFVGCGDGSVGSPEDRAKTMGAQTTPSAGTPAEGTAPAGEPGKDAAEAPKEPAPAATEAAEAK